MVPTGPRSGVSRRCNGGPDRGRTRVITLQPDRMIRIPIAGRDDWEHAARESA